MKTKLTTITEPREPTATAASVTPNENVFNEGQVLLIVINPERITKTVKVKIRKRIEGKA